MSNIVNATYAPVLRVGGAAGTAWHQTDKGLLWAPPGYKTRQVAKGVGASDYVERNGIVVKRFELHNRSGGVAGVGIGGRLDNRMWRGGRLSADGATFTDLTSTLQAQLPATLQATGADQTGFCLLSRKKFDAVSVNMTTAETNDGGATAVDHTVAYSTGATWTTLGANAALTDNFTTTNAVWDASVHNLVMFSPADWTPTAGNGGVPDGYYGIRFTSVEREAVDVAAIATGVELFQMLVLEALADNGIWEMEMVDYWLPDCESLVAYFGTANAGNRVYAEVETR